MPIKPLMSNEIGLPFTFLLLGASELIFGQMLGPTLAQAHKKPLSVIAILSSRASIERPHRFFVVVDLNGSTTNYSGAEQDIKVENDRQERFCCCCRHVWQ